MPGNPLVRFDEGRVGRTARCRPRSYSTEKQKEDRRDEDRHWRGDRRLRSIFIAPMEDGITLIVNGLEDENHAKSVE
jgi:hypothetical protein